MEVKVNIFKSLLLLLTNDQHTHIYNIHVLFLRLTHIPAVHARPQATKLKVLI